mmetsp:Transcript_19493/g.50313  ORF Transcript_19493/g.50313 Transcript_19493/m.50313 type:complete len:244 (+) Transcript_19493:163-894(+)
MIIVTRAHNGRTQQLVVVDRAALLDMTHRVQALAGERLAMAHGQRGRAGERDNQTEYPCHCHAPRPSIVRCCRVCEGCPRAQPVHKVCRRLVRCTRYVRPLLAWREVHEALHAAALCAVQVVVQLIVCRHRIRASRLHQECVLAALDAEPAAFAPKRAPRVACDPILGAILCLAPACHFYVMVDVIGSDGRVGNKHTAMCAGHIRVASVELLDGGDVAHDRAARKDLAHHGALALGRAHVEVG